MPPKRNLTLSKSVVDSIDPDAVCVITREAMDLLLNNNKAVQNEILELSKQTAQLNTNLVATMDRLADIMQNMSSHTTTTNTDLGSQLDRLIEAVSKNNIKATNPPDIEQLFGERKELLEKRVRNEKLSNYYQELLSEDPPFVRREFRTHVNKTAPEDELEIRRKQATNTVEAEISIMQNRAKSCAEKQRKLDETIQKYMDHLDDETEAVTVAERMATQERKVTDGYEKVKIAFFRNFDTDEKGTITEFCVKFSEDKVRQSRNYRDRGNRSPPRRRRPPWRPPHGSSSFLQQLS